MANDQPSLLRRSRKIAALVPNLKLQNISPPTYPPSVQEMGERVLCWLKGDEGARPPTCRDVAWAIDEWLWTTDRADLSAEQIAFLSVVGLETSLVDAGGTCRSVDGLFHLLKWLWPGVASWPAGPALSVGCILRKLSRLASAAPDSFDDAERASLDLAAVLLQAVALPNGRWSVRDGRRASQFLLRYDDDHLQPGRTELLDSIRTHYAVNEAIQHMLERRR